MNKIQKILKFAMRMEQDAGDFYSFYMDKVKSESTKELFKELVETEKYHFSVLKSKFDEMGFTEPPITVSWVVDNNFTAKDPHIIADNSDVIGGMADDATDLSVVRMAYLIENDFAEFYKNAAEAVEDEEAKKFLNTLADWEIQHKEMFHKKYQSLMKKHWEDISEIIFAD